MHSYAQSVITDLVMCMHTCTQSVVTEKYFTDPHEFWTGATAFPLNYHVPLKHNLFYQAQIGFYLQVRGILYGMCCAVWAGG